MKLNLFKFKLIIKLLKMFLRITFKYYMILAYFGYYNNYLQKLTVIIKVLY